ncbi:MAG TPA: STAS domain-containing protein [Terriglobia bacterium]|nr:STAS domain-containing protein [Terriglobia bacterium]
MSLETRKADGDVVILKVGGRLAAGEAAAHLRDVIQRHLDEGVRKLVIDLEDVFYVDSSGLGALITGFTSMRNLQGDAKLLKPTKRIKDLLQITRLLTVFEVFDDEAKAVESFKR